MTSSKVNLAIHDRSYSSQPRTTLYLTQTLSNQNLTVSVISFLLNSPLM
jgi:hypothetical protein